MIGKLLKKIFGEEREPSKEEVDDHLRERFRITMKMEGYWPHKVYDEEKKRYVLGMDEYVIAKGLDAIGLATDEEIMQSLLADIRTISVSVGVSNMNLERVVRRCVEERDKYED